MVFGHIHRNPKTTPFFAAWVCLPTHLYTIMCYSQVYVRNNAAILKKKFEQVFSWCISALVLYYLPVLLKCNNNILFLKAFVIIEIMRLIIKLSSF